MFCTFCKNSWLKTFCKRSKHTARAPSDKPAKSSATLLSTPHSPGSSAGICVELCVLFRRFLGASGSSSEISKASQQAPWSFCSTVSVGWAPRSLRSKALGRAQRNAHNAVAGSSTAAASPVASPPWTRAPSGSKQSESGAESTSACVATNKLILTRGKHVECCSGTACATPASIFTALPSGSTSAVSPINIGLSAPRARVNCPNLWLCSGQLACSSSRQLKTQLNGINTSPVALLPRIKIFFKSSSSQFRWDPGGKPGDFPVPFEGRAKDGAMFHIRRPLEGNQETSSRRSFKAPSGTFTLKVTNVDNDMQKSWLQGALL